MIERLMTVGPPGGADKYKTARARPEGACFETNSSLTLELLHVAEAGFQLGSSIGLDRLDSCGSTSSIAHLPHLP